MPCPAKTWIVVPCYNEARRLPTDELLQFAREHPDVRFLLVDDGSIDDTRARLDALEARNPSAFGVLAQQPNRGKASAVRLGMNEAIREGATYAGFWDADLATPLREIPRFVEILDAHPELELLLGSRVKLLGRRIERNELRHYVGRVSATAISLTLALPVYDTQCGAKLFRVTDRCRKVFEEPFISNWAFDVEIIARLLATDSGGPGPRAREVMREVPLWEWRDVAGSKVTPLDFFRSMRELWRIRRRYLR